jgi:hypothetical protein
MNNLAVAENGMPRPVGDGTAASAPMSVALRRYYVQEADVLAFRDPSKMPSRKPLRPESSKGSDGRRYAAPTANHMASQDLSDSSPSSASIHSVAAHPASTVTKGRGKFSLFKSRTPGKCTAVTTLNTGVDTTNIPPSPASISRVENASTRSIRHSELQDNSNSSIPGGSFSSHSSSSWLSLGSPNVRNRKFPGAAGGATEGESPTIPIVSASGPQHPQNSPNLSPTNPHLNRLIQKFEEKHLVSFPPVLVIPKPESASRFANCWMNSSVEDLSCHSSSAGDPQHLTVSHPSTPTRPASTPTTKASAT